MSSTKRGAERSKHDFYETPAASAAPVMAELRRLWGSRTAAIVDAGAGMGALTRGARAHLGQSAHLIAVEAFPADLPMERAESMFERGAIEAARARGASPYVARLEGAGANQVEVMDYLDFGGRGSADIVVSNPPFSAAMDFLQHTVEDIAPDLTAFLLRLNFLGSDKRAPWFEQHPPQAIRVLVQRPNFTGEGTDSIEYAWMLWGDLGLFDGVAPIGWYR